jgi:hypothetical protein
LIGLQITEVIISLTVPMRLEINIPDERPEAQILGTMTDPRAYVLELVRNDRGSRSLGLSISTPDYARIFADARNCPSAFKTREEMDRHIDALRSEW